MKKYSDQWFLELYFKFASVEEAIKCYQGVLPISSAQFHRLVAKSGVIKSPGRHSNLPEVLHFFKEKAMTPGMPIEKLYKKMPYDFKSSVATLHRVYNCILKKTFRRDASALIIFNPNDSKQILVGQETHDNRRYGKSHGDWSIPMGFSRNDESDYDSALRIAQHEVSVSQAIYGKNEIIAKDIKPFMFFDLLDVRIKVYKVNLKKDFDIKACDSFRLVNHKFMNVYDFLELESVRIGVKEIIERSFQSQELTYQTSKLNRIIYKFAS